MRMEDDGLNYTVVLVGGVITLIVAAVMDSVWYAVSTFIILLFAGLFLPDPYKKHLIKKEENKHQRKTKHYDEQDKKDDNK